MISQLPKTDPSKVKLMATNDLVGYMRDASAMMQSEYERIRKRAAEDPGTAGDNGEENWAELLRQWLPSTYQIATKGRIMNRKGECGPQVDVVVLSSAYPKALITKKEYLEAGVVAAFECKITLRSEHVSRAVEAAAEIRRIASYQGHGTPHKELRHPILYGLLAHSHSWKGEASKPIENIERGLHIAMQAVPHPSQMIDLICVSDLATWTLQTNLFPKFGKRPSHFPEDIWNECLKAGGMVQSSLGCYVPIDDEEAFTPIGVFLRDFYEKLAWKDVGIRDLQMYFSGIANPPGKTRNSSIARVWPIDVLSRALRRAIADQAFRRSNSWFDEWAPLVL